MMWRAELRHLAGHVFLDQQRLTAAQDLSGHAADRYRFHRDAFAVVVDVWKLDHAGERVDDADVEIRLVEDLADLVADGVVDALHVHLGRKCLLDAVDHRQLGGALFGLVEQSLRLVELAGVLQSGTHGTRQRLQQPDIGLS